MKKKVLFFLRSHNDIDHMTPVIWKWASTADVPSVVILVNPRETLDDYRIRLLQSVENLEIRLLDEVSAVSVTEYAGAAVKEGEAWADQLLQATMGDVDKGLVVFDWISDIPVPYRDFATNVVKVARDCALIPVSLPHGDEPHYCKMILRDRLSYDEMEIYTRTKDLFDKIAVPNELCAVRFRSDSGGDKVRILGSPRYNDEWLTIVHEQLSRYEDSSTDGKLKILLFMRPIVYPIFWEEVVRTIRLLARFSAVHLILVHHTRGRPPPDLFRLYPDLAPRREADLDVIAGDIQSTALIRWADVILDLGTSAVFEAIKLDKPVLELEYLHATYTTISHYMNRCVMMCRDHLYEAIKRLIDEGCEGFYDQAEKEQFVREMIDVPDKKVLPRYVEFLSELLDR
ncbi:hypothetical protein ACFL2Q_02265 [Thermodesulfobacteriota bacterium]